MNCPLCGSDKKSLVRDRIRFGVQRNVYACGRCSMVYLERLPKGEAEKYYASKEYRARYGPSPGTAVDPQKIFDTYLPFQKPIIDELTPILKKSMRVLDVGCSTGHFLRALKGKVATRVGLELGKDEVAFIRKKLDFPVYDTPIEDANIKEGPFDLVTCLQVLEHIEDPKTFLTHLLKNLKPGGYLYIEVPNLDDILLSQYAIPGYADFYYREPHASYFSASTLAKILQKVGINGKIGSVQRYSFINHLHWLITGKPQGDFVAGNKKPELLGPTADAAERRIFNTWFAKIDAEYRVMVAKRGLGESLSFLGRKKR